MSLAFFHGTSTATLAKVHAAGGLENPYLTDTVDRALYYAELAAEADGSHPVVLRVADVNPAGLRHDTAAMDEPVLAQEETRDRIWDLAAFLHPEWVSDRGYLTVPDTAWVVSWAAVGSARYVGTATAFTTVDS